MVDDEEDLCEILKFNLENEGYEVDTANSAEEALKMNISSYHLLLLDVMMGEISGFKMANLLKKDKKTAQVPIIFITAKDTENDTVTGFNLGADDYISKPFSLREVIARVKAVLRRTATSDTEKAPEQLCYQSLVIDITKKESKHRRRRSTPDQERVRNPLPAVTKQGTCLLARRYSEPDLERRSLCTGPHHRRQHHPVTEKRSVPMANVSSPAWDTVIASKRNRSESDLTTK